MHHTPCTRERCDCYNGAQCDHVNGQCRCLPGYKGEKVGQHGSAAWTGWGGILLGQGYRLYLVNLESDSL